MVSVSDAHWWCLRIGRTYASGVEFHRKRAYIQRNRQKYCPRHWRQLRSVGLHFLGTPASEGVDHAHWRLDQGSQRETPAEVASRRVPKRIRGRAAGQAAASAGHIGKRQSTWNRKRRKRSPDGLVAWRKGHPTQHRPGRYEIVGPLRPLQGKRLLKNRR